MKAKHILLAAWCCVTTQCALAQTVGPEKTFTRGKVLMEKHTGLRCSNCMYADEAIDLFNSRHPEYEGRIYEMRHNSYASLDMYARPFHTEIADAWNVRSWPAVFVDRCHPNGTPQTTPQGYNIGYTSFYQATFDPVASRLAAPTCVSLSLDHSVYDPASGTLTVRVSGEVTKELPALRISVFLTEDIADETGIACDGTSRAMLNQSVNGDFLPLFDGRYDVAYTYKIPSRIGSVKPILANMHVVAFVSSLDETDYRTSEVHNCDVADVTALPAGEPLEWRVCAKPTISLENGELVVESSDSDAMCIYSIKSDYSDECSTVSDADLAKATFTVSAYAVAYGCYASPKVSQTFTLLDLLGERADVRDVNGDGRISISDLPALISLMRKE